MGYINWAVYGLWVLLVPTLDLELTLAVAQNTVIYQPPGHALQRLLLLATGGYLRCRSWYLITIIHNYDAEVDFIPLIAPYGEQDQHVTSFG